eukprot:632111-Rhodomonas_salina.1
MKRIFIMGSKLLRPQPVAKSRPYPSESLALAKLQNKLQLAYLNRLGVALSFRYSLRPDFRVRLGLGGAFCVLALSPTDTVTRILEWSLGGTRVRADHWQLEFTAIPYGHR